MTLLDRSKRYFGAESGGVRATRSDLPEAVGAASWLWVALFISVFCGAIACFWGRPWIISDTATGLLAWRAWLGGGPWNCLLEPDPANIANNAANWVSWWSPGQYVWPGLFTLFGLPLGAALVVSAVIAAWIRSIGFFRLLCAVGFSHRTAGIAVAVEAANWHIYSSFGMYSGGEIVQASFFPWMMLALFHLRDRARWWLPVVPPLLFVGAFAKHSMFIAGCGGVAWLWWEANTSRRAAWRHWLFTALLLGCAVLAARWGISKWIVGPGPTPASHGHSDTGWSIALGYPLFAPLSAATGLGSVIGRIFFKFDLPPGAGWQSIAPWLITLGPIWLLVYGCLARHAPSAMFRRIFVATLAAYVAAMTLLYARGASVSIEDRHVRPAGMLVIAALAGTCLQGNLRPRIRQGLLVVLFGIAGYGVAAEIARAANLARLDFVGPSGISQPNISRVAVSALERRDREAPAGSQIVFVGEPSIALELKHSRIISSDAIARPLSWFQERRWRGRVPRILLVLPATWVADPREAALRDCFADYAASEWQREIVGDCLFVSVTSPNGT